MRRAEAMTIFFTPHLGCLWTALTEEKVSQSQEKFKVDNFLKTGSLF